MNKTVEIFYDFGSPATYLAYTQMDQIAARTDAMVIWKPALLGGIFKEAGNRSPATVPAKGAWMWQDLGRHAVMYGVPFQLNAKFPVNTLHLMRGALVAHRDGFDRDYRAVMFKAMWVDNIDLTNGEIVADLLADADLDVDAVMDGIEDPVIKQELIDRTAEAVERGAFGMPTFFVGDEMHFGQDRLYWVELALSAGDDSKIPYPIFK